MMLLLLLTALLHVPLSSSWIMQPQPFSTRARTTSSSSLVMMKMMRPGLPVESLQQQGNNNINKTIHYRSFHRLTDDSDVLHPHALTVEERHMGKVSTKDGTVMIPYGRKLLILRNENKKELLRFRVDESERHVCTVQEIASILYLACEEPHLVLRNKVIQLSCGLGLMGLLGTLSVGMLSRNDETESSLHVSNDHDIFPTKQDCSVAQSLLPPNMQSLTLSDTQEDALQLTTRHLHHVVSPTTEAYFSARQFDWRLHPRFNHPIKPFYGGILSNSCNTLLEYPSAKELARTVAFYLEPNGRFVHVTTPNNNKETGFLKKFLHDGYLLNVDERLFTVESQYAEPQYLEEEEQPAEWKLDDTKGKTHQFVALLASHHPDYDGFNGEYLFPMENGKFENKHSVVDRYGRERPW